MVLNIHTAASIGLPGRSSPRILSMKFESLSGVLPVFPKSVRENAHLELLPEV